MGRLSQMESLGEVTPDDLFLVTDDTTGKSRAVKWSAIEQSIDLANVPDSSAAPLTEIDCGVYAE